MSNLSLSRFVVTLWVITSVLPSPARSDIYLLRHAEKLAGSDPALSGCGWQRADALGRYFQSLALAQIWSTPYQRTQSTAFGIARYQSIDVLLYDPDELVELANLLLEIDGDVVVVGHSNTTPALVRMLTNEPVSDMDETDYDLLYQVTPNGEVTQYQQSFQCRQ